MRFEIYCDADFNPLVEDYNDRSNVYNEMLDELESRPLFAMDLGLFDFD